MSCYDKMRIDMKHLNEIKPEPKVVQNIITNPFISNLYTATSMGRTENDAVTFTRSGSPLLDFYAQAGAMRPQPEKALDLFQKAFSEDRQSAVRILFYLRDIRGGQGERTLFRICLQWLGETYPDIFEKIVTHVPEYGRWDDLFFDNEGCFSLIKKQIEEDKTSESPSLLAKWLPSANASSRTTQAKAKYLAGKIGMNTIAYRRLVRDIRKKIKLVEQKMSACEWGQIDYPAVPSQASRIYRNAFKKHDEVRYGKYIEAAEKGEVKINAATLYPYQIYKSATQDYSRTLEALWNQLPDYTQGKNALVVADVSGSMTGDPMAVSVSLALYFAERNKGQFKDHFITFSGSPKLQRVMGANLQDKMNSIERSEMDMNTNLQAVFDLVLNTAVKNSTPAEQLPETIYIISDMEFDQCCDTHTNFEHIKSKYQTSGYAMPNLVFWNVNASGSNLPTQKNEQGVALVSGFSPVIFKIAVEGKTPEAIMLETVNSERYAKIVL